MLGAVWRGWEAGPGAAWAVHLSPHRPGACVSGAHYRKGTWAARPSLVRGGGAVITDKAKATGFPGASAGKESACSAGDLGSIPGLGRSAGEGKGYPLQYSGLENSMDCIELGTTEGLSLLAQTPEKRTVSSECDLGSGQLAVSVALVAPLPLRDHFPSQSHTLPAPQPLSAPPKSHPLEAPGSGHYPFRLLGKALEGQGKDAAASSSRQ